MNINGIRRTRIYGAAQVANLRQRGRRYLALPNVNKADLTTAFKIKKGTPYIEGKVASQIDDVTGVFGDYAEGGGVQIYVLFEDADKLIKQ